MINKLVYFSIFLFFAVAYSKAVYAQDSLEIEALKKRMNVSIAKTAIAHELMNMIDAGQLNNEQLANLDRLRVDNWKKIKRLRLIYANLTTLQNKAEETQTPQTFSEVHESFVEAINAGSFWKKFDSFLMTSYRHSSQNHDSLYLVETTNFCEGQASEIYNRCICTVEDKSLDSNYFWSNDIIDKEMSLCEKSREDLMIICQIFHRLDLDFTKNDYYFDGLSEECNNNINR